MKRAVIRLDHGRGGWIHTTIAPINDKHEARFGKIDVVMFGALVLAMVAVARLLLAH